MLTCVGATIQRIIAESKTKVYVEIFDERRYPLGDGKSDFVNIPTLSEVIDFLSHLINHQELSPEISVMACTYIDRVIGYSGTSFTSFNWRRIVLSAILVAEKVTEESQVWNVDFKRSFPKISISDVCSLERLFLRMLKYELTVSPSVYATYYFGLRAVAGIAGLSAKPLGLKMARKLQVVTCTNEELMKRKYFHEPRSKTMDSLDKTSGWLPLCLEEIKIN